MAVYDKFAQEYSSCMGERGDEAHQNQIDPYIYKIIGDLKEKTVCDLGCGNGYMARFFAKNNAHVYASDISKELIKIAKKKSKDLNIKYSVHSADDLSIYQDNFFDIVVMNMSIHYIRDLRKLFSEVSRTLKDGGVYTFSTNHFFRPNTYSQWELGKTGNDERLFIKVTNYLGNKGVKVLSGWDKKTKMMIYNHTLNSLVNEMSDNKLLTFKIYEPEPVNSGQAFSKKLQQTHRILTFIIIGAIKQKDIKLP